MNFEAPPPSIEKIERDIAVDLAKKAAIITPIVVIGLGIAVVWMLWEVERVSKPRRNSDRLIASQHLLDPGGAGQHRHR